MSKVDFYAFEMLTGQRIVPLPVEAGTWKIGVNADDATSCTIKADSIDADKLDVWGSTTLARNGLLVTVDGQPVAAGPIWKRSYAQGKTIELTGGGLWSYWDRRVLLPAAARGQSLVDSFGKPRTVFDTNLSGLSYGTIAKRWVELVRLWPGGQIPMMLPPDEAGTRERNIAGIELKKLRALLENLTSVQGGPDIAFRPRWAEDGLGIYWEMQVGTNAQPWLGSPDPTLVKWSVGSPRAAAFELDVTEDATGMAEEVFASGGRNADVPLFAQARNTTLPDAGFPLLQAVDSTHSDVVVQGTLNGYAQQGALFGQYPSSFWSMKVRANELGSPTLGSYWVGDMATVTVDKTEPVLPAGDNVRRIATIGGDAKGDAYDIVFAEAVA